MSYQQRLALFCFWADFYNLKIIRGFEYDEKSRGWASDM